MPFSFKVVIMINIRSIHHNSFLSMASPLTLSSSILIIGGGTWGVSTALHLARLRYDDILVLDSHPIPSAISAGNDINKIVELGT